MTTFEERGTLPHYVVTFDLHAERQARWGRRSEGLYWTQPCDRVGVTLGMSRSDLSINWYAPIELWCEYALRELSCSTSPLHNNQGLYWKSTM